MKVSLPMSKELKERATTFFEASVAMMKAKDKLQELQVTESRHGMVLTMRNGPVMLDQRRLTNDELREVAEECNAVILDRVEAI